VLCPLQAAPSIFPAPREFQASGATFALDSSVAILVPATASNHDLFLARFLTAELSDRHQVALPTRRVDAIPMTGRFILMGSMENPLVREYCVRLGINSSAREG
jgi:hypothetical protein